METSKQTKEDAKEWRSRFEPYQTQVEDISQKLKFLRYDHELMLKGYRFRYIIDSYDILKHVFPFKKEDSPSLANQSPEEVYRRLVREQIALGFIFHGLANSLILIPPYLLEIHGFLEFQRRRVRETTVAMMAMGLERYGRQLREVIENSGVLGEKRFQSIDELIQDLILSFDKDTILNLAADHYKDLLALLQLNLSEMQAGGSALLVKLIQKKRLAPPEYVLDGFTLNEKDLNVCYPQRKAALANFQSRDQSAEAAINDIVALEYIRQMNEHGATADRKEIVLFIGSSVPMLKVLEKEGTFGMAVLPEGYNFARCPEFWLAFLMLRKGMFYKESQVSYEAKACEETLDEIEAVSYSINMFQSAIKAFAEVEKTGLITQEASDYFERAGGILEKVKSKLNSWENFRLILNEHILPNLVSKTTEHGNKALKSLADFMQSLHDTVTPSAVEDRLEGILDEVEKATDETHRLIDYEVLAKPGIQKYLRFDKDDEAFLRVGEKERYLHDREYEIHFTNPEFVFALQTVRDESEGRTVSKISEAIERIRSLDTEVDEMEVNLFWATLFFLSGRYAEAKSELERTPIDEREGTADYYLLCTIVNRLLKDMDKAEAVCSRGLAVTPRDPRLNREMAGIFREKWKDSKVKNRSHFFDEAVRCFRMAIGESRGNPLRLECLATLAALYVVGGGTEAIQNAKEALDEYERIAQGMKKRHARYWWAASQLSIVTAGEKGVDKERSNDLLEKAKQSIEEGKKIDARLKWSNLERRIERIHANVT